MSFRFSIIFSFLILLLYGCGGIEVIHGLRTDLYTPEFISKIDEIKKFQKDGQIKEAITALHSMADSSLTPVEQAVKYNFLGTILFSKSRYDKAITHFIKASSSADVDKVLVSQINLNLSSSYFKISAYDKSLQYLTKVDDKILQHDERERVYRLGYVLGQQLGDKKFAFKSLVRFLGMGQSLQEIRQHSLLDRMMTYFLELESNEKMRALEDFEKERPLSAALLAYREAELRYFSGDGATAKDLLVWMKDTYGDNEGVIQLADEFLNRLENIANTKINSIGIVLPFSGKKESFSERAMYGIDFALKEFRKNFPRTANIKLHVRDSQGSGIVGASVVKGLIESENVSVVIGGLFSGEAANEYLEAKKRGTLFISLSPVYLPRSEKNHLLIEIPGSVESQIEALFSDDLLKNLGNRAAIIYSQTPRGLSYMNEFWRKANTSNVQVTAVQDFDDESTDFRDPIKKLLGLKYIKERQEEMDLWSQIHTLLGKSSIRRIQTLAPVIDFDWVFVSAYPHQALQIIPSFRYFDAPRLSYVGGPSWRSRALLDESKKLGRIFFLGDDISLDEDYQKKFFATFNRSPKLIETFSLDAMNLLLQIIGNNDFTKRVNLEKHILSREFITGLTGKWKLSKDVWLKEMHPFKMQKGEIQQAFLPVEEPIGEKIVESNEDNLDEKKDTASSESKINKTDSI